LEHGASNPVSIKNLNATETSTTASDGDCNYNDDISNEKDMIRNRKGRATEQLVNAKHRTYIGYWNTRTLYEIRKVI
jgi:hypothetical protein